ncbi:type III PLP-dependent enzyme [Exilibacterium tricleocarpae]|uniref:ornithine decarboxylase n=1 Tax=Exilibacterium tricleocarpae TaxID=2591008 RepID=A0A545U5N4_9GAMM|nr:type III PLP-dependent enzyme [Exilibacterium tricleocarpae]TQV84784.1 type III PLP-dependent enzyme [Exilibacterium tricleocarpae]
MGCQNTATEQHHPHQPLEFAHTSLLEVLRDGYPGPFLLMDSAVVRDRARQFHSALPNIAPHFAVKANPDLRILKALRAEGVSFEIASRQELELLLPLGVAPADIFFSNPVKPREHIAAAAAAGVEWFAIDSIEELRKVHSIKPDAKLYLRIFTSNEGSVCPLSGKFGAHPAEIRDILAAATALQADLAGVTFHVGSQCTNIDNWRIGIRAAHDVLQQFSAAGLTPQLLDLGGGFPVRLGDPVPDITDIAKVIREELDAIEMPLRLIAEPGRFLVAEAGCLVTSAVGTTLRNNERWLYLDAGFYSGLMELKDGIPYILDTERNGRPVPWTIAGPTCDSIDVCFKGYLLPDNLAEGDLIYVRSAGAYSSACSTRFNGFPSPEVLVI